MKRLAGMFAALGGVSLLLAGCPDLTPLDRGPPADAGLNCTDASPAGDTGTFGAAVVLLDKQVGPIGIAIDEANVYWTNFNEGTLKTANKSGANVRVLATTPGSSLADVVVDGSTVYFSAPNNGPYGVVAGVDKLGGTPTTRDTSNGTADRLTMDAAAIYALRTATFVRRYPKTGGYGDLVTGTGQNYYSLASNGQSLFLGADDVIYAAPLGDAPTIFATGQKRAVDIVADATSVYWGTLDGNIVRLDADKANQTPLVLTTGQGGVRRLALDGANVYWTTATVAGAGRVATVAKTGGSPHDLASGLSEPAGIAVDDSGVYFTDKAAGIVYRVPK
jgi:hypothetical protein